MLEVNNVSKSFGEKSLLNNVSFTLNAGQRAGLTGPNGSGKTTLLRIIMGDVEPDAGHVRLSPAGVRVGYLAQAPEFDPDRTVTDVLRAAMSRSTSNERQLEELTHEMAEATGKELSAYLAEYERILDEMQHQETYGRRKRLATVLSATGMGDLAGDTVVGQLSGGQKTRLGLALLLLSDPDLLLLDEPTNHLDFEALEWLEDFLSNFAGAVLVVSHDQAFLDRLVGMVLALDPLEGNLNQYMGNYSNYLETKGREREKQLVAYKDQRDYIARLTRNLTAKKNYSRSIEQGTIHFHPRKIAKGIARQAVVQQRRIQRLLDSEERLDKPKRTWSMNLEFADTPPSGHDVLQIEDLGMRFGSDELFRDVRLTLRAGERVALVGPNGSGKTTLLRLITGQLRPTSGKIKLGSGVSLGYYAQEQENLDPASTPFEIIRSIAQMNNTEVRRFLHRFLFAGDDVFVPVRALSPGERARLVLAQHVAQGCNLLLLDEPINHLDIRSRSQFEQAMSTFEGTVLMVVHDRCFIDRFATGLWAVRRNCIRWYPDRESMKRPEGSPVG